MGDGWEVDEGKELREESRTETASLTMCKVRLVVKVDVEVAVEKDLEGSCQRWCGWEADGLVGRKDQAVCKTHKSEVLIS